MKTRFKQKRYWIPLSLIVVVTALAIYGGSLPPTAEQVRKSAAAKIKHDAEAKVKAAADRKKQTAEEALKRKVYGTVDTDQGIVTSGDAEANAKVTFSDFWCRWNDGRVEIHVIVKNPMAAHITAHLQPSYHLLNAGQHGDGFGSSQDIGVDAGATREYTHRLDTAEGVKGTPAITSCDPHSNGVDLG